MSLYATKPAVRCSTTEGFIPLVAATPDRPCGRRGTLCHTPACDGCTASKLSATHDVSMPSRDTVCISNGDGRCRMPLAGRTIVRAALEHDRRAKVLVAYGTAEEAVQVRKIRLRPVGRVSHVVRRGHFSHATTSGVACSRQCGLVLRTAAYRAAFHAHRRQTRVAMASVTAVPPGSSKR